MEVCVACSMPLRPGARFCTRCGTAVAARPTIDFLHDAPEREVLEVAAASPSLEARSEVEFAPRAVPTAESAPDVEPLHDIAPLPDIEPLRDSDPLIVPARIPAPTLPPPPRVSRVAVWTLVTGTVPLLISIAGNAFATVFGLQAVQLINAGQPDGAWAPLLATLTTVFIGNAVLLIACAMLGGRALRETADGTVRGRPFAVAGLAIGAVNLILWATGLVLTMGSYSTILS